MKVDKSKTKPQIIVIDREANRKLQSNQTVRYSSEK